MEDKPTQPIDELFTAWAEFSADQKAQYLSLALGNDEWLNKFNQLEAGEKQRFSALAEGYMRAVNGKAKPATASKPRAPRKKKALGRGMEQVTGGTQS